MGMSYSVYCGPAAVCKPGKINVKKIEKMICPDCSPIKEFLSQVLSEPKRFCPACGTRLVDITYMSEDEQASSDVIEAVDDALWPGNHQEGEQIYIPNARRPNRPRNFTYSSHGDAETQTLTPHQVAAEVDWFRHAYSPELIVLSELFGADNVVVKFVMFGRWT
jgi:hypothetical protein